MDWIAGNWELMLKTLSLFISLVLAVFAWKRTQIGQKTALKTDLEILNLLGKDHQHKDLIKHRTDNAIKNIYDISAATPLKIEVKILCLSIGGVGCLLFTFWSMQLLTADNGTFAWSWWVLLTGVTALYGAAAVLVGLELIPLDEVFGTRSRDDRSATDNE